MIYVLEPVCHDLEHTSSNAARLNVIRAAFPEQPIRVMAERRHLREVRRLSRLDSMSNVEWIDIIPPSRTEGFWRRAVAEARLFSHAVPRQIHEPSLLVCLAAAPSTLFVLKGLQLTGRIRLPIQVFMHGVLGDLVGWRSRNPIVRATDIRSALSCPPRRTQIIVLEDAIRDRLNHEVPSIADSVVAVPNPLPDLGPPPQSVGPTAVPPPLRVGFLGLATPAKGFTTFLDLARRFSEHHPGLVEFHAIGSFPRGVCVPELTWLTSAPAFAKISREEYVERLRELHYVCLPYTGEHYELTSSAVLLDALAAEKPLIAHATASVRALFKDTRPGYLCGSVEEIRKAILTAALNFTLPKYAEEVEAVRVARESRLPEKVARTYRRHTEASLQSLDFERARYP